MGRAILCVEGGESYVGVVASKVGILYRGTQTPRHESTPLFFILFSSFLWRRRDCLPMTPPAMSPSSLFAPFQCSLAILTGHYQRPTPRWLSQCQYCSIIADIRLSTTLSHLQIYSTAHNHSAIALSTKCSIYFSR